MYAYAYIYNILTRLFYTFCIENFWFEEPKTFENIYKCIHLHIFFRTATALEKIECKLKENGIKYVMHTSRTDDKLKDELEDVNNKFWKKFQVVLYSPTIESGTDFNEEHFDRIYCILKDGQMTCSQRGFLQMVGRIRKIKDPKILCYYDGPTNLDVLIYIYTMMC